MVIPKEIIKVTEDLFEENLFGPFDIYNNCDINAN